MKRILLAVGFIFYSALPVCAQQTVQGKIVVDHKGQPQEVHYRLRLPENRGENPTPVLVCVGGLPIVDGQYIHSDTGECDFGEWLTFADAENIAILGLGFLFVPEDWQTRTSYQYPQSWSGKALLEILKGLSAQYSIDPDELYLFGISAGAQFATRLALMQPEIVRGVAAHAAGGYDDPAGYVPVKFLVTVGELDDEPVTRLQFAKKFVGRCRDMGVDIDLKVIPGTGHRQTEEQNVLSRIFFRDILRQPAVFKEKMF